eukprot:4075412-Amphidinium_carterae.1
MGGSCARRSQQESRASVLQVVRKARWNALEGPIAVRAVGVWWSDHTVVLTAVQRDGRTLRYAAEALKGDREIVLAAVQNFGYALQYATEAVRADREI